MNIKEALKYTNNQKLASVDAEVLLSLTIKKPKEFLYTYPNKKLTTKQVNNFENLINKRKTNCPIAYLTNKKEFYGLEFYIDERVLIPRPETELLVEKALKEINRRKNESYIMADIGTGSGCIAVALARELKAKNIKCKIYGIDISEDALKVAELNAKKHKVKRQIEFLQGNLLEPLPEKVDIIIANLPYISTNEMKKLPPDIKKHEPKIALDTGQDGLKYYRELLKQANKYLKPDGITILEIGSKQKNSIIKLINRYLPKSRVSVIKDYAGLARIIKISL